LSVVIWLRELVRRLRPDAMLRLSPAGQAQLLKMSFDRLRYSVSAMPVMSAFLSAYLFFALKVSPVWVLGWGVCYLAALLLIRTWHARFKQALATVGPGDMISNWQRKIERLAAAHGLGISLLVPLTMGHASHEFMLILYVLLVAILSANSGQMTPFFSIFHRMFWGTLGVLILMPWALPDQWLYLLPMSMVMSFVMYRSAINSHLFFVRQVELEALSQDLAIRYREASEAAAEALQQKSEFLTTASHDLRQPVHAMNMLTHAAMQSNRDARVGAILGDLNASMRSLTLMLNALLDLSRLDSGALQAVGEPVSLSSLVKEVATLMRPQAQQRGLAIRVHVPPGAAMVQTDPVLIRQALINLTHNALRYTLHGGILVAARRVAGAWQIEVWDTGVGIATDDQERVFLPYFRHALAWRIDNAGHGLGLAVVARCARLMRATVGLQSRLGEGSRFWLRLPPAPPMPATSSITAGRPATTGSESFDVLKGCCLVVDDDLTVQAAWRAMLNGWGLDARFAEHGQEAFAFIDAGFVPHAILCDQRLRSGESGFELLVALLARCPQASGAMVSGELDAPQLKQAEDQGYLVLRKPVDVQTLHTLLRSWLIYGGPDHSN